jgi:hypothetical protein
MKDKSPVILPIADCNPARKCATGEKVPMKSPSGARGGEQHKPMQILCILKLKVVI